MIKRPPGHDAWTAEVFYGGCLQIQLQISLTDPSGLPGELSEDPGEDGGKDETDHEDPGPHPGASAGHGGIDANGAHKTAGPHARACRDVFQL